MGLFANRAMSAGASEGFVHPLFGVLFRYPEEPLVGRQGQLPAYVNGALAYGRRPGRAVDDLVDQAGAVDGALVDLHGLDVVGQRLLVAAQAVVQDAPVGIGRRQGGRAGGIVGT